MAKIKWTKIDGDIHEAIIKNTGVTLVVSWENTAIFKPGWKPEVWVGDPRKPGTGSVVSIGSKHTDLEKAKLEALKTFKHWAHHVLFIAQTDGYGHYIDVATGDEVEALVVGLT